MEASLSNHHIFFRNFYFWLIIKINSFFNIFLTKFSVEQYSIKFNFSACLNWTFGFCSTILYFSSLFESMFFFSSNYSANNNFRIMNKIFSFFNIWSFISLCTSIFYYIFHLWSSLNNSCNIFQNFFSEFMLILLLLLLIISS